jgi:hypothetical protein
MAGDPEPALLLHFSVDCAGRAGVARRAENRRWQRAIMSVKSTD